MPSRDWVHEEVLQQEFGNKLRAVLGFQERTWGTENGQKQNLENRLWLEYRRLFSSQSHSWEEWSKGTWWKMDTTAHHEIPTAYYAVLFATVRLGDGPLEKLWVGGGGFSSCMNFFSLTFPLQEYSFLYARTSFLGYSLCMNFFLWIFPCMNFFCTSPAPHNFSNGPYLNYTQYKAKCEAVQGAQSF